MNLEDKDYKKFLSALEVIAMPEPTEIEDSEEVGHGHFFSAQLARINKIMPFKSSAILLKKKSNYDFYLEYVSEPESLTHFKTLTQCYAQEGVTEQAVSEQRMIKIAAQEQDETHVLYPVFTKHDVYGVLVGIVDNDRASELSEGLLNIFAVAMKQLAYAFETYFLYNKVTKHNRELEIHIRERTLELQVAKDEAVGASKTKSEFLSMMSHEIRTPLNGVLGMLNLLKSTALSDEQMEHVKIAYQSGENLLEIINDVLDFSKIEAGKLELENIIFSPREIIEEALHIIADKAYQKSLEIGSIISPDIPRELYGDPTRFRQIILNLISNAVKFTEKGQVFVYAQVQSESDDRVSLRFEVRDTGVGIAAERLETIFDAFSQADPTITRTFGGSGLGLAICDCLVSAMGGKIDVESKKGEGSTFGFTVKLKKVSSNDVDEEFASRIHDLRIVIADKSMESGKMLSSLLQTWEVKGQVVTKKTDLFALLNSSLPEVLILNNEIEDANAEEILSHVKNGYNSRDLNIILLMPSANILTVSEVLKHDSLIKDIITTPVRYSHLYHALCSIVGVGFEKQAVTAMGDTLEKAYTRSHAKLLLVEDNDVNQKVVTSMLEKCGMAADIACDGEEAITMHRDNHYDLILMDCHMPKMDGFSATEAIRRQERARRSSERVAIIAITADNQAEAINKCLTTGMDSYITKPFRIDDLRTILDRWVL